MACFKQSGLEEYLEQSEPSVHRRMIEASLASCGRCRANFEHAMATHRRVSTWLGRLTGNAEVDSSAALNGVLARTEAGTMFRSDSGIRWNFKALGASFLCQGAAVTILMLLGTSQIVRTKPTLATLISPPPPVKQPKQLKVNSGSGGGQHAQLPPLRGPLPKPALRVFTPTFAPIDHPALTLDVSLIAPADAWASPTSPLGNPLGAFNGGPGTHGGPGSGNGGPGTGTHGSGSGSDDLGIYSAGNGITAPTVLSKVDPEYSEEARKAKYNGAVMLSIIVNTDGRADSIRVVRSLGMGLDEKAIEAVQQWRFRPGTNKGIPVRVRAQVEVNFRLL